MGKLYLSDTLKLILSDKVNVPDNEIEKLSGTFYKDVKQAFNVVLTNSKSIGKLVGSSNC